MPHAIPQTHSAFYPHRMETRLKFIFEQIASVARTVDKFFFERIARAFRTDNTFFKRISQVVRTDDNFFWTDTPSRSNGYQIRSKTANRKERFRVRGHAKGLTKYVRYVH